MNAKELMESLARDPEYQQRMEQKQNSLEESWKVMDDDELELVAELSNAGYQIDSVWDLVNTDTPYPDAIPILMRHLEIRHHPRIREGITRSLICNEAKGVATRQLINYFKTLGEPEDDYKWVLAMAIAGTATEEYVSEILELARDKRHGRARGELLYAMCGQGIDPSVIAMTISEFIDDPDTNEEAKDIFNHLKSEGESGL